MPQAAKNAPGDAAPGAPLVTIIIVNFNAGTRLGDVLFALDRQTERRAEVLIVDNASTDDSLDHLPEIGLPVRILRLTTNTGFAGGIMTGAEASKAAYIAPLNPDAYPEPDWLSALVAAAGTYGPLAALGSIQRRADDPLILDGLGDAYHISGVAWRGGFGKPDDLVPEDDREVFAVCFAACLLHRETFLLHGGLDRDFFCYHEDVDFGFRHRLYGGSAVLVRDAVVHHEGSGITGRYSDFTVFHGIRNRQWTFLKNMPLVLWPIAVPALLVFALAFLVRSFMLGIGRPYVRGFLAGFGTLGPVLEKRREVQGRRAIGPWAIARAMVWSPLAPLRRAPDLRPAHPLKPGRAGGARRPGLTGSLR